MDLPAEAERLTGSRDLVTVWTSATLRNARRNPMANYLYRAIDDLGIGSQRAQGLNHVLTSVERICENPNHRLYIALRDRKAIGILKIGTKKLFIRTKTGELKEIDPLCVLDFYVHESEQRSGYGKVLYDAMLEKEHIQPHKLGYDRPSPKFLSFLRKHFALADYVPQTNNFVVFEQYFGPTARAGPPQPEPMGRTGYPMMTRGRGGSEPQPAPANGLPQQQPLPQDRRTPVRFDVENAPGKGVAAFGSSGRTTTTPSAGGSYGSSNNLLGQTAPSSRGGSSEQAQQPAAQPLGGSVKQRGRYDSAQAVPRASAVLAASLPPSSHSGLASAGSRRDTSPTRSAVEYNIITLQGAAAQDPAFGRRSLRR